MASVGSCYRGGVRLLATLMAAAIALSSSGLEWLACEGPCEGERGRVALHEAEGDAHHEAEGDAHHDDEGDAPCGPGSADCSCCFNLRLAVPDTRVVIVERVAQAYAPVAVSDSIPDPSPGEILHVPRAA